MSANSTCPNCQSPYGYSTGGDLLMCPECGHEWNPNQAPEEEPAYVVRDSNGTVLADGDAVVVVKNLPVKGSPQPIKAGTKVKNIRLVESTDGHNIDCRIEGFGSMTIKSEFVKKA